VRALNHKRKARRAGAKGSHTKAEIKELLQQQNNLCANPYCRIDISGVDPKTGRSMRHLDHIVPLVKGGSNSIENLQWLCITCNTSKHDKDQDEWLEEFAKVAKVKARKAA
jgi:5-methylcytosine-specific restriction endonuclease McrA